MTHERITILFAGRLYSGTYCVANDFVSVSCGALCKTTRHGGTRPKRIAEALLRQLARSLSRRGQ